MLRRLLPQPWPIPLSLSEALWQRVHTAEQSLCGEPLHGQAAHEQDLCSQAPHAPPPDRPLRAAPTRTDRATTEAGARSIHGPFRLSDRWWERTALRDYYYLRTDDESWLWLFRERVTGRWYLHGWLD
jgi:hypothetical protein